MEPEHFYPPLPALPREALTERAWRLLERGVRRGPIWLDHPTLGGLPDHMLPYLEAYHRPTDAEGFKAELRARGIEDPALLQVAVDFEMIFGGCAWEIISPPAEDRGSFHDRKSFSVQRDGNGQLESHGVRYVACGELHYSTPVQYAIDTSGRIGSYGLEHPEPNASSMRVLIEDDALRQEWITDIDMYPVQVHDSMAGFHLQELGLEPVPYAFDTYVQWWQGPGLRVRLTRPWSEQRETTWEITARANQGRALPPSWEWWRR